MQGHLYPSEESERIKAVRSHKSLYHSRGFMEIIFSFPFFGIQKDWRATGKVNKANSE